MYIKKLIQFLSNTPVYISLVYSMEIMWVILGCFLSHQYMLVLLKSWSVELIENLPERSLSWYLLNYVWMMLDYSWALLISAISALKKHWYGLSFNLNIFFLEHVIVSWEWCMIYSMSCLRAVNVGSVQAFVYPIKRMVRY